jgi:hypothetical protein
METITFQRGKDPKESMGIGVEYYRKKKMEAVNNQKYEEAVMWRDKEKECLQRDEATDNGG